MNFPNGTLQDLTVDIQNNVNGGQTITISASYADIDQALDDDGTSLNSDVLEALEEQGISLLYHDYDPATGELTIQGLEVNEEEEIEPVDAYVFQVIRGSNSYQCYLSDETSDLTVQIAGTAYYCKRVS